MPAWTSFGLVGAAGRIILPVDPGDALQGVSLFFFFFFSVLGGGITVTSWSVRRVDVKGGHTRLHVSGAGPSQ